MPVPGTIILSNCTVAYNRVPGNGAKFGGGLAGVSVFVAGSIIADNGAANGSLFYRLKGN